MPTPPSSPFEVIVGLLATSLGDDAARKVVRRAARAAGIENPSTRDDYRSYYDDEDDYHQPPASGYPEDDYDGYDNYDETALLAAYLKQCRRYPGGVLAVGGDVVLMNPYLRRTLDATDQQALMDHAAGTGRSEPVSTVVANLPSGATARITAAEHVSTRGRSGAGQPARPD